MIIKVPIPEAIQKLAMEDPSVLTALQLNQEGVLTWGMTLEHLVVVLAKQKKELQAQVIKLASYSAAPKKIYVNMSSKEIDKLLEDGQIKLKKPTYEDNENES